MSLRPGSPVDWDTVRAAVAQLCDALSLECRGRLLLQSAALRSSEHAHLFLCVLALQAHAIQAQPRAVAIEEG